MVEYILEGENVELDVNTELEFTDSINDIRNPVTTNNAWTKEFNIPGTPNNNKIFKHVYDGNIEVGYDPNIKKFCEIRVDSIPVLYGYQRVTNVDEVNGQITYTVVVYGVNTTIFEDMGDDLLSDLDLSDYDHTYTPANVEATWETTNRDGFYYPFCNYQEEKWTYQNIQDSGSTYYNFFPGFYVKTIIDKIFETNGYTYESSFFDSNVFKSLYIPFTNSIASEKLKFYEEDNTYTVSWSPYTPTYSSTVVYDPLSLNDSCCGTSDYPFVFFMPQSGSVKIVGEYEWAHTGGTATTAWLGVYTKKYDGSLSTEQFRWNLSGDTGSFEYLIKDIPYERYMFSVPYIQGNTNTLNYNIKYYFTSNKLIYNLTEVKASKTLPTGLKQKDLFKALISTFNLYIEANPDDIKKLTIESHNDYYDLGSVKDWTYKVDVSSMKNKLMSEINSRSYRFTFKEDSDYLAQSYRDDTEKTLGELTTYVNTTFFDKAEVIELPYSSSAIEELSDYTILEVPSIYKEGSGDEPTTKWNWRLLSAKGLRCSNTFTYNSNTQRSFYTGSHVIGNHRSGPARDDQIIWFDYGLSGYTSWIYEPYDIENGETLYTVYWQDYMNLIKNQNSRLTELSVNLTPYEISELRFYDKIFINDKYYYLNKLVYSPTSGKAKAELLLIPATELIEVYIRSWEITNSDSVWITENVNVEFEIHNDSLKTQSYSGMLKFFSYDGSTSTYWGSSSFSGTIGRNSIITDTASISAYWHGTCYVELYLGEAYYDKKYLIVTNWADYIDISNVSATTPVTGGTNAEIDFRIENDSTSKVLLASNYSLRTKYYSDSGSTLFATNNLTEQTITPSNHYDYNDTELTLDDWCPEGNRLIEIYILYPGYSEWTLIGSDTYYYYNANTLDLIPTLLNTDYRTGTTSITVDAYSTNEWSAVASDSWIGITSGSTGEGDGTITIDWQENSDLYNVRYGNITVSHEGCDDDVFLLIQDAYPYGFISPTQQDLGWDGLTPITFNVSSNYPWEISSDKAWLQITGSTGNGDGSFEVNAPEYISITGRTATLSIELSGGTVDQDQTNTAEVFQIPYYAQMTISETGSTDNNGFINVEVDYPWGQWSATTSDPNLCSLVAYDVSGITSGTTITGNGRVYYSANGSCDLGVDRTIEFIIDGPNIFSGQTFTIELEGSLYPTCDWNNYNILYDSGKTCVQDEFSGLTYSRFDIEVPNNDMEWIFSGNINPTDNFIFYYSGTTTQIVNGTTGTGPFSIDAIVNPTSTGGNGSFTVSNNDSSEYCSINGMDYVNVSFTFDSNRGIYDVGYLTVDETTYIMNWSGSTTDNYLSGTTYVDAPDGVYWIVDDYLYNGEILSSSGGLATRPPMTVDPNDGTYCGTGSGWFQWYITPNSFRGDGSNDWINGGINYLVVRIPDTNTRSAVLYDQSQNIRIIQRPPDDCFGARFELDTYEIHLDYKDIGVPYVSWEVKIYGEPNTYYELSTGNTWITISGSTNGTTNGNGYSSFIIKSEENPYATSRLSFVYVDADGYDQKTIFVYQDQVTIDLDPEFVDVTGVTSGSCSVTTPYANYWTASATGDTWITLSNNSGFGDGSFDWEVDDTLVGSSRTGYVHVESDASTQVFEITQWAVTAPTPTLYWKFDGTIVDEITGLTLSVITGTTTYTTGNTAGTQALYFNNVDGTSFEETTYDWTGLVKSGTSMKEWSASLWIWYAGDTTISPNPISFYFNIADSGSTVDNYVRSTYVSSISENRIYTRADVGGNSASDLITYTSLENWHHIVINVEQSGTTGCILRTYIDVNHGYTEYEPDFTPASSEIYQLIVGSIVPNGSFSTDISKLQYLRFYDRKLTPQEVAAINAEESP